jgi:hypothetical protein
LTLEYIAAVDLGGWYGLIMGVNSETVVVMGGLKLP